MGTRIRITGDSPHNQRDERGSRRSCLARLAELVGFSGIVAATVLAALLGLVGCKPVDGAPSPRTPYSEDANKPDYACHYDGNRRCPRPTDGSVNR